MECLWFKVEAPALCNSLCEWVGSLKLSLSECVASEMENLAPVMGSLSAPHAEVTPKVRDRNRTCKYITVQLSQPSHHNRGKTTYKRRRKNANKNKKKKDCDASKIRTCALWESVRRWHSLWRAYVPRRKCLGCSRAYCHLSQVQIKGQVKWRTPR